MKSEVKENNVDFSLIRYSQCWEDTEILLESLDIKEDDICFGIGSAGDNVLSMLTKNPKRVIILDINFTQLALIKLKVEIIKNFEYEKAIMFFGVLSDENDERIKMYNQIKNNLDKKIKNYWDNNIEGIKIGVNHIGKFENFFKIFRIKVLPFVHSKNKIEHLFKNKSKKERQKFYKKKWCNFRWKIMFKLFFSNYVIGKLGRDKKFFKYVEEDISKVMLKRVKYALSELNPSENPYLSYILKGNYSLNCLPYFLRKENFEKIKQNLNKVEIIENSIEEYLENINFKINKFNLSDIFEYMSLENYEKLMDKIYEKSENNAILVYWNLVVPRNSNLLNSEKFERLKEKDKKLHKKDKTFFYNDFVIEKVKK